MSVTGILIASDDSSTFPETWVPICLPQFNQNSFLYAHISYLWEGAGPCLLLLSVSRDSFDALRTVRLKLEEAMLKRYAQLKASLSHPEPFSFRQVNTNDLRHFIYRNTLTSQVCCSTPQIPYINHEEVLSLYEGYFKLSNMLRRGKNVKMLFLATENFSLFSWVSVGNAETDKLSWIIMWNWFRSLQASSCTAPSRRW